MTAVIHLLHPVSSLMRANEAMKRSLGKRFETSEPQCRLFTCQDVWKGNIRKLSPHELELLQLGATERCGTSHPGTSHRRLGTKEEMSLRCKKAGTGSETEERYGEISITSKDKEMPPCCPLTGPSNWTQKYLYLVC